MSDKWNAWRFFDAAKECLESKQLDALRSFYRFFSDRSDPIKWGPSSNPRGGFQIGVNGIRLTPFMYGYINGCLAFYTGKLDTTVPKKAAFREGLESYLATRYGANVDNESHYELHIEEWGEQLEDLLARFKELLD